MSEETKNKKVPLITKEYAEQTWNKIEVICPDLDTKTMSPIFQLRDSSKCPMKLDGKCGDECTYFMGTSSDDGTYFAHGVYDGYCNSKGKEVTT